LKIRKSASEGRSRERIFPAAGRKSVIINSSEEGLKAKDLFLLLLSASLFILSYPDFIFKTLDFSLGFLAWFAAAPLAVWILRSRNKKQAFFGAYLTGFITYLGLLCWVYPTITAGGVYRPVGIFATVALSAVLALEFGIIGWFCSYVKRAGVRVFPLLMAGAWVSVEYIKMSVNPSLPYFPWFLLAYTQWDYLKIVQIVSIVGPYGLSWLICFTGAALGVIWFRKDYRLLTHMWSPCLLITAVLVYGFVSQGFFDHPRASLKRTLTVSVLQPCVDLNDKWDSSKEMSIRESLETMVRGIEERPDIILWPENALPGWIDSPFYSKWVKDLARESGAVNIVGSVSRGDARRVAAVLVDKDGNMPYDDYYKRILVPFGEYVPFRRYLSRFIRPVAALGEFIPGDMKQDFFRYDFQEAGKHSYINIAPTLCYESIFPFIYKNDTVSGADIFVNLTNDGWYLDTAAPRQHLIASVFRAVESRRPIVRAANNGISAYITPSGRLKQIKKLDERGIMTAKVDVPAQASLSFYDCIGDVFAWACMIFCFAFLLSLFLL